MSKTTCHSRILGHCWVLQYIWVYTVDVCRLKLALVLFRSVWREMHRRFTHLRSRRSKCMPTRLPAKLRRMTALNFLCWCYRLFNQLTFFFIFLSVLCLACNFLVKALDASEETDAVWCLANQKANDFDWILLVGLNNHLFNLSWCQSTDYLIP